MRIVGGNNKGRRIKVPKKGIRPTKGLIRGAIFNIIGEKVCDVDVLDVFAGSGALGLEAVSRGAKTCVFIEKNPKFLHENIKHILMPTHKIRIFTGDFRICLKKLIDKKFDIIFLDPPYRKNYVQKAINLIAKYHLSNSNGIIVIEHHRAEKFAIPMNYSLAKTKHYGETSMLTNGQQKYSIR
jgi:16S rRNA (guanine966-N2)-methyltransferase